MKDYSLSLFIFRRDLRLDDNTALIEALKNSEDVACIFIFDPRQVTRNSYKSDNAIQFMIKSLEDLNKEIKKHKSHLSFFQGEAEDIIDRLLTKEKFDAVYINADYTPFSTKRDNAIEKVCKKHKVDFYSYEDVLLNPPDNVLKSDKKPYQVFTPYFKKAFKQGVSEPHANRYKNYYTGTLPFSKKTVPTDLYKENKNIFAQGGRTHAKKILRSIKSYKKYAKTKDIPSLPTTGLSPHIKFGTCSLREVFVAIKKSLGIQHPLIRQLYWHDFFAQLAFYFPSVFKGAFREKYDKLDWNTNKKFFKAWCEGKTGFPIVDAGMRQLNETGFMHNRVRMIVASFLVKDLHINWQDGERYFAQQLVDYDPAVNNGNWQWCASTGADAQPYFRIFNPWLQQKKFDPECLYIKEWVPELKDIPPKMIHSGKEIAGYPSPIVDHRKEAAYAKKAFKKLA